MLLHFVLFDRDPIWKGHGKVRLASELCLFFDKPTVMVGAHFILLFWRFGTWLWTEPCFKDEDSVALNRQFEGGDVPVDLFTRVVLLLENKLFHTLLIEHQKSSESCGFVRPFLVEEAQERDWSILYG